MISSDDICKIIKNWIKLVLSSQFMFQNRFSNQLKQKNKRKKPLLYIYYDWRGYSLSDHYPGRDF